jgi:hypothetical protein
MSPYQIPDDMDDLVEEIHKPLDELFEELKDLKIDDDMKDDFLKELFNGEALWK